MKGLGSLGLKSSDLIISTIIALFAAWLTSVLYNLAWFWILGLTIVFDPLFLFLLRNQSKNYRKWSKHPTTFPNPVGGGIVGEYMLRPWQNEMTEIGGRTETKNEERQIKRLNRGSRRKSRRMRQLQNSGN